MRACFRLSCVVSRPYCVGRIARGRPPSMRAGLSIHWPGPGTQGADRTLRESRKKIEVGRRSSPTVALEPAVHSRADLASSQLGQVRISAGASIIALARRVLTLNLDQRRRHEYHAGGGVSCCTRGLRSAHGAGGRRCSSASKVTHLPLNAPVIELFSGV